MRLVLETENREFGSRHWLRVRKSRRSNLDIFFDFIGENDVSLPAVLDGHVQGVIHRAMSSGEDIIVPGPVSRKFLHNISEYQDAMVAYFPAIYQRIEIVADEILDLPGSGQRPRGIAAFSGGVDGSFSFLRHRKKLQGEVALPLDAALLIHHRKLDDEEFFSSLARRIKPFVDYVDVKLHLARTNLREVIGHDYLHTYGAQLGSALHNYSDRYDYGVIGSSEPYVALILPFGSSPVTDHLMSGGAMKVIHDGAGFTRTEKVELVAKHPVALKTLHVCLAVREGAENCGRCMKCVRTRLNFLAVGVPEVPALPEFQLSLIDRLRFPQAHVLSELQTILDYARSRCVSGEWVDRLQARIDQETGHKHPSRKVRARKVRDEGRRRRLSTRLSDWLAWRRPNKDLTGSENPRDYIGLANSRNAGCKPELES